MKHEHGFTLIELAVVLTITALLIGSFLIPLTTQIDIAKIRSTEETLQQVKDALIHYAAANNRLPCPATEVDTGLEVNSPMNCQIEGYFPWANFGMGQYDAWGNPFIYRVDQAYTEEIITPSLTTLPSTFSDIEVRNIQNNIVVDVDVVAIIYSNGKDGKAYQPAAQFPIFMGSNNHLRIPLKTISNLIIPPAFALNRGNDIYYQDTLIPNQYDDVLIFLSKNHLVTVTQRTQTTTVPVVMPVLDETVYTPVLPIVVSSSDSEQTDTGSTDTGSTDTGSTDTGSTDTGSTDTGSTDTGSTDTGSTDTGSTDTGSTDTGTTDPNDSSSDGMNRGGDGFNQGGFDDIFGGLLQFDSQP